VTLLILLLLSWLVWRNGLTMISLFFLLRVSRGSRIMEALFLSLVLLSVVLVRLVLVVMLGRNLIALIELLC
jgi:hypothetical protein